MKQQVLHAKQAELVEFFELFVARANTRPVGFSFYEESLTMWFLLWESPWGFFKIRYFLGEVVNNFRTIN
ncbi:MAG: hypothetical protein IE920_04685 [Thiotrichales bacterium]|nr:hypothetical protein [Thiotrichales bacterium]